MSEYVTREEFEAFKKMVSEQLVNGEEMDALIELTTTKLEEQDTILQEHKQEMVGLGTDIDTKVSFKTFKEAMDVLSIEITENRDRFQEEIEQLDARVHEAEDAVEEIKEPDLV